MSEVKFYCLTQQWGGDCSWHNLEECNREEAEYIGASDYDAAQSELAALREELAGLQHWRDLALQFDSHRMAALWHLKALLQSQEHAGPANDFLDSPPLAAHEVTAKLTAAEQRNAALAELLSKGFNCMESSGGKYRITMDFRTGDECFEAYSALCNLCHCDTLVREPQPTESGASE